MKGKPVRPSMGFVVKSAIYTAILNARGISSSLASCEGRLPVLHTKGKFTVGKRFMVRSRILKTEIGAALPTAYLRIGDRVFINQGSSVVAYAGIEIGDDTRIGELVTICDTNHHDLDSTHAVELDPVVIGANVWLGRGVTVFAGSKIGEHVVVAAGSVVRGEIPPRVLATGNPAKPVKELDITDGWTRR